MDITKKEVIRESRFSDRQGTTDVGNGPGVDVGT